MLLKSALLLKSGKHVIQSVLIIIVEAIIKVEVQADMNDVALKPAVQMVVGKEGGNVAHPFQMDGDDCDRGGIKDGPELSSGSCGFELIRLEEGDKHH